jgi:hypothetical protein
MRNFASFTRCTNEAWFAVQTQPGRRSCRYKVNRIAVACLASLSVLHDANGFLHFANAFSLQNYGVEPMLKRGEYKDKTLSALAGPWIESRTMPYSEAFGARGTKETRPVLDCNHNAIRDDNKLQPVEPNNQYWPNLLRQILQQLSSEMSSMTRFPPFRVDDPSLLLYDIILLVNLVVSISFWVTHRLNVSFIGIAFSEGCLLSIAWILAGLYTGAFLYSAVDGHYNEADRNRGGPLGASLLGFNTYLNAVNMRLLFSLIQAFLEHRPVGSVPLEQMLPLEIGFGFVLMTVWRLVHSMSVPR